MFYDPLRHKEVPETPEERVRQWFIALLRDDYSVPEHMMMSEVGFKFGNKQFRADILLYNRSGEPMAVVECKRPDVELGLLVAEQAMRYNSVLKVKFIILTNGNNTYIYALKDGVFSPMDHIPQFEEMLCRQ